MNLYYINSGETRYFSKKTDAQEAAQKEADKTHKEVIVSVMFIAVDRNNITRMANQENGFTRFVGRVCIVEPRKRPKLKLRKLAAAAALLMAFLLPNLSEAETKKCTTRKSGSVTVTTCSGKNFHSECRSRKSGSVIKTDCNERN
jgi:hypothetical protein